MTDITTATAATTSVAERSRKMAREPQAETARSDAYPAPAKRPSKINTVLELLKSPEGATLDQLVNATGWLPHTTRAALTGLKKKGHAVNSEKVESVRRYRIDAGAA